MKGRGNDISRYPVERTRESLSSRPTLIGNGVAERIADSVVQGIRVLLSQDPKVYTIDEVAEMLKVGRRTIEGHLYEKRDLRYLKVGREVRIRDVDIRRFLGRAS